MLQSYHFASPSQIKTVLGRAAQFQTKPEGKMWLSVLAQAVEDLVSPKGPKKQREAIRDNARAYFVNGDHELVCNRIGLNPEWVTELLQRHCGLR
jgi:hypothetical protein